MLWLSALNLKDIPYNSDFCQTLDMVDVKHVLSSCLLCPKSGLNLPKKWLFTSVIQDTNVIVGLKLVTTETNVATMLCAKGKKLNLV